MSANSRAKTNDDSEGLVKVLVDAETDKILGAHIFASAARDLIAEMVLAILIDYYRRNFRNGRLCTIYD